LKSAHDPKTKMKTRGCCCGGGAVKQHGPTVPVHQHSNKPRVAQTKLANAQPIRATASRITRSAPAAYRPQSVPKVLQRKSLTQNTQHALPVHGKRVAQAKFSVPSGADHTRSSVVQMSHKKQKLYVKVTYSYKINGEKKYGTYEDELSKGRAAHPEKKVATQGCDEAVAAIRLKLPAGYTDFVYECTNYTAKG
jgi:hypothetical protein